MKNTRHFAMAVAGLTVASALIANRPVEATEPFFMGLGDLPGGITRSVAYGLSADGSTVVGDSNAEDDQHAYVWTMATGMRDLGPGIALDASADGSVVAGVDFRWSEQTGRVSIGGGRLIHGAGISADGSVIASTRAEVPGAFRWTEATGTVPLGTPFPGRDNYAADVSADGIVVVGSQVFNAELAFRWTEASGFQFLGRLPGANWSIAKAANADGSVVVGFTASPIFEAFRWTQSEGMVGLGDLPGGAFSSSALDVTPDGSLIVGFGSTDDGRKATVWDAVNGMRDLNSVFLAGGLDLTDWTLTVAEAVSADGRTFAGTGTNPLGNEEAWIASLGPLPGDFNNDGTVDAADYVVWRKNPGGIYTLTDLDTWRSNFGHTVSAGGGSADFGELSRAVPSAEPLSAAVPEPTTFAAAGLSILGLAAFSRRRRESHPPSALRFPLSAGAFPATV